MNLCLAAAPSNVLVTNVLVTADDTGLPKDSVVNVSQIITVDKSFLTERMSQINDRILLLVETVFGRYWRSSKRKHRLWAKMVLEPTLADV